MFFRRSAALNAPGPALPGADMLASQTQSAPKVANESLRAAPEAGRELRLSAFLQGVMSNTKHAEKDAYSESKGKGEIGTGSECVDAHDICHTWAKAGLCHARDRSYREHVNKHCCLSCTR